MATSSTLIRKGATFNGYTLTKGITVGPNSAKNALVCAAKNHDWTPLMHQNMGHQIGMLCRRCRATAV